MSFRPERINRWYGVLGGSLATVVTIAGFTLFLLPDLVVISSPFFVTIIGALVWISLVLFALVLSKTESTVFRSPIVLRYYPELSLIVVRGVPWLGLNIAVTLYAKDQSIELLLASGYVYNIQDDGLVQIRLTSQFSDSAFDRYLVKQFAGDLIVVKPGAMHGP